jgi:hypothetical protein
MVLLDSPQLLYLLEDGGTAVGDGVVALTAWELAARLSYHFWDTMPDRELRDLAADGSLLDDAVWAAQVERAFADPRTDGTVATFFGEWLELEAVPPLDLSSADPRFAAFAGSDLPGPELAEALAADVHAYVSWLLRDGAPLDELFTSPVVVASDPAVAALYGTPPWDGASAPPEDPGRPGILTRPAALVTGTHLTQPIHKGLRVRERVLCDELGDPPANAGTLPDLEEGQILTRREQTEQLTEDPTTSCNACHQYINHPGYLTEGFDALGRARTEERVYAADGTVIASLPVDTVAVPQIEVGDLREVAEPAELMTLIVDSGKVDGCFSRFALEFTLHRAEDEATDQCWVDALARDAAADRSLADLWKSVALRPDFKLRRQGGAR